MSEDQQTSSVPEIVEQGIRLTIHGMSESVQTYVVTYQWIDFKNCPTLLDQPEQLVSAEDAPSFTHVAIHLLSPDEDLTELVMQFQNSDAKGVVLVYTTDNLPVFGLNPPPCDDVNIPVVLIKQKIGQGILKEVQDTSKTVNIVIARESSVDAGLPEYQTPEDHLVVDAADAESIATPEEKPGFFGGLFRKQKKFHLTQRLEKLLYDSGTKQPAVMWNDNDRILGTFQLLDEYEAIVKAGKAITSNLNKKMTKICGCLQTCMQKNYALDFPYHFLMVVRLVSQPVYRNIDAVEDYQDNCIKSLCTLTAKSMETVFVPFLGSDLVLPWGGKERRAIELLDMCFKNLYKAFHGSDNCQSNESVADFGVALVTAQMSLVIQHVLGPQKKKPDTFWKSFIKKLNPALLPWSQELLLEIKNKIDLAPSMGLPPKMRFDCNSLMHFLLQYELRSFAAIQLTISCLYASLPIETSPWVALSALTRTHVTTIVQANPRSLKFYSDAGDLKGYIEKAQDLILTLYAIRNYSNSGSSLGPPVDEDSADEEEENLLQVQPSLVDCDVEIGKWIELIIITPFLQITNPDWGQYVLMMRKCDSKPFSKLVKDKVVDIVTINLVNLDVAKLLNILLKLLFIPKEVVGQFLRQSQPRPSERLNDGAWRKLFQLILKRTWNLKPDILTALKAIAHSCYEQGSRPDFLLHLLVLAQPQCCPTLLSGDTDELLVDMKEFLIDYLRNVKSGLQGHFTNVLTEMGTGGQSPLRHVLLEAYCELVIPSSEELSSSPQSTSVTCFLSELSKELTKFGKTMRESPLPNSGIRYTTCWHLLVHCCRRISPSRFNLANPPRMKFLADVLPSFSSFWPQEQHGDLYASFSTNSEAIFTDDMKEYGSWHCAARGWLQDVQQRVLEGDITLGELQDFAQNYKEVQELYESFMCSGFLLSLDDIECAIDGFEKTALNLSSYLLYFAVNGRKWGHLKDLLVSWNVAIDDVMFRLVDRWVSLIPCPKKLESKQLPPKVLSFKPDVSISQSKELHDRVCTWLAPVTGNKDLLCYFSAHESVLFQAYLETELKNMTENFSRRNVPILTTMAARSGSTPQMSIMRPTFFSVMADNIPDSDDDDEDNGSSRHRLSLEDFNRALNGTFECLRRLLDQTAVFQDVSVIGQDRFKGVDVKEEFAILVQYPDFTHCDVEAVRRAISDMLSLLQYSAVIETIVSVCKQYDMTNCLSDRTLLQLQQHGNQLKDSSRMDELTTGESSQLKSTLDELLLNTAVDKLHLFDAVQQSEEFFVFIRDNKFYAKEGKSSFFQQVGLITNQLQDQEYNETVLSHLRVAFQCILPFADPNTTFADLLQKLKSDEIFNLGNWIYPIQTVNSNITTIKMWFSKSEGDTIENVTRDLEAILASGSYEFALGLSSTDNRQNWISGMADIIDKCQLTLVYTLEMKSVSQRPVLTGQKRSMGSNGDAMASLLVSREFSVIEQEQNLSEQVKDVERRRHEAFFGQKQLSVAPVQAEIVDVKAAKRLLGEELDDFVRKLGFMQGERGDQQQSRIKEFLRKNDLMLEMFEICSKLHKLGHPQYRRKQLHHVVATSIEETERKVKECRCDLNTWQGNIYGLQRVHKELLFFSVQRILALAEALINKDFHKATDIVSALFSSSQDAFAVVATAVCRCCQNVKCQSPSLSLQDKQGRQDSVSPFNLCGKFLNELVKDKEAACHLYPNRRMLSNSETPKGHVVHVACSCSADQVFRLLLKIYGGLPESFEMMRCSSATSREELELFLQRALMIQYRTYVLVNVNQLNTVLQEHILRFQLDTSTSQSVRMHYIMTGSSIIHSAPWIKVKQYKDDEPKLSRKEVDKMCRKRILEDTGIKEIQLVYGRAGDGKSHYIKKQMNAAGGDKCTIAVHEAFSLCGAIKKLQNMTIKHGNGIYFNVTLSPPSDTQSAEFLQYQNVMNTFSWFLFDLFGLGFVQDPVTGLSYRLRAKEDWMVYVEVPSILHQVEAKAALKLFYDHVPCLKYVGTEHHVAATDPLDVDDDIQLVCKYLRALRNPKYPINRLYESGKEVKISRDCDLSMQQCQEVLLREMGDHVKDRKIMQQLFVKYMKRRCDVLENAPGFNFNTGVGEYIDENRKTDTKQLGSTLLSTMLKEVNSFCHPDIQEDWKHHPHQQLVYDITSKSASFLLLSLDPNKLHSDDREKFETIGVKIPSVQQLNDRTLLDRYLSSALDVDLEQIQAPDGSTKYRLSAIDNEKYVLTVDYAIKMLNIHERRMCGVPVVIEGETGVGKTALVQMLSILWNQSLKRSRRIALERISELLQARAGAGPLPNDFDSHLEAEDVDAAFRVALCINTGQKPVPTDVRKVCAVYWQDIRKVLLAAVMEPSMYILDIDRTLIAKAMDEDSAVATAKLLEAFVTVKPLDTFFKLSVHAALTPEDITNFFQPKFQEANKLLQLTTERGGLHPPTVVIFLDEINTSSCMGLFKELLVDRSLDGNPIPSNVFLVAACNPHRGSSVAIRSCSEQDDWVLGSYYVRPLPPTLQFLTWDYGALDPSQEHAYIQEKIAMNRGEFEVGLEGLQQTSLIAKCQSMIRDFANEQLCRVGFTPREATVRAKSCVSQRDIQRVFSLTSYFEQSYRKDFPSRPDDQIARHAIMLSLGIVYYLRLDEKYRKQFSRTLKSLEAGTHSESFEDIFMNEIDYYVEKMHIPIGIAKTRTLKENLFATVVCTSCRLPLIIVGAPGSSKTLSFNLTLANLKGAESRRTFFHDTKRFPALDSYHYQCSRRSTSLEIENVFKRAIKRQQNHSNAKLPINCVVFMDEAGLPEESHESLKVLHYYLDDPQVSFVAITNHILDAAKSNRAVSLFRPQADEEDLKTLARGCLCTDPANPSPELRNIVNIIEKFCSAYASLMRQKDFEKFFGLRDFIHFISYIRRHRGSSTELTADLVLKALERNFNGVSQEKFRGIADAFLSKLKCTLADVKQRNTVEVLQESLADLSLAQSGDNDGVEAEVRYKLIIDTSGDASMTRLLFMYGVLNQSSTRTFTCSDFPDDGDIQKVHIISAIKHAALEGRTVILRQTDDINESFYDLFNQHFRRIDDPNFKEGRRYYANIAIGSHSKPCRVDPKFQCIVHMQQCEVNDAPSPFLNRFEKFLVSQDDLLQIALDALPTGISKIIAIAKKKGKAFQETVGEQNFYGAEQDTLQSLFLDLLPPPNSKQDKNSILQRLATIVHQEIVADELQDDEDDEDNEDSYGPLDEKIWNKQAPVVISELEDALIELLGFRVSKRKAEERIFQTEAIFSATLKQFDEHDGTACRQELLTNSKQILGWLAKGILHLTQVPKGTHSAKPFTDSWQSVVTTRQESFAIAVLVQWTVFHVCSSLLKIAAPESLIMKREHIPQQYILEYLNEQPHFSLKNVVSYTYRDMAIGCERAASKVICFTRTTSVVHSLPLSYPANALTSADSHSINTVEKLLPGNLTTGLRMLKLESIRTLEAFTNVLEEFVESDTTRLFLVIANMKSCSQRRINHVRSMIEECEKGNIRKHFILLLHFPSSMGFSQPCYPTLFLYGWEHLYLDSIFMTEQTDPVDLRHWMQMSCTLAEDQKDFIATQLTQFSKQLRKGLEHLLPLAINVATSRVLFGDNDIFRLNRKMDARTRTETLQQLLNTLPDLSEVLCEKFANAWDIHAVSEQLMKAAHSQLEQNSCLTVSERIQDRFRTLFYNYVSLFLYQLNRDYNLEILFGPFDSTGEEVAVKGLFVEIVKMLPVPQLNELRLQNHTFDARQSSHHIRQKPAFPFFSLVAQEIDQALDDVLVEINEGVASSLDDIQTDEKTATKMQKQFKPVRLFDIEDRAASNLLQLLKMSDNVDDNNLPIARRACKAVDRNESLWERYLADFARVKLHCHLGQHKSQEHRLLSAWLGCLQTYSAKQRVVVLHIIARLRQKSIRSTVAVLRPLESLEVLHPDVKPLDVSLKTESGQELEGQLYTYIINVMYGYLENMFQASLSETLFIQWCDVYNNLSASLPAMRLYQSKAVDIKSKLQAIHIVFVFMRALKMDKSACAITLKLACEVCATCNAQTESVHGVYSDVRSVSLGSVTEIGLSCLREAFGVAVGEVPAPGIVDDFVEASTAFVEDVLTFYFPSLPSGTSLFCSLPDCHWLMTVINKQDHWSVEAVESSQDSFRLVRRSLSREESVQATDSIPVGLLHFKVVQSCLMQALRFDFDTDHKIGFSSVIRLMVGQVLCEQSRGKDMRPFIPTCYPKALRRTHSCTQCPLASVYFHCCLKQLKSKFGNADLPHLLRLIEQYDTEIQTADKHEKAVLLVERQAVTQVFIRKFSDMFDLESVDLAKPFLNSYIIRQVNQLFDDPTWGGGENGGHVLAFLHHLSERLMSTRSLIDICTDQFNSLLTSFPWMRFLVNELKEKPRVQPHLLPFMENGSSAPTYQSSLYKQVSLRVIAIAQAAFEGKDKTETAAVDDLCDFCRKEARQGEGNSLHLRMMLWLAIYYHMYEQKIQSNRLVTAVYTLDCIGMNQRQCQLLSCFIAPERMVRCSEPLNPINENEVRLELHGTEVRRRRKRRNEPVEETDPIWDLFSPSNVDTQDTSDIDLRRTLALLAAVVMGLPAGSTHLWTHMFEPGHLEGTFVTGNLYPNAVKREGLLYDCGCELTADGDYGRADYIAHARSGTLNLHSLYLLLWLNFGGFCLSLLTQPDAQHALSGGVISDWQSVRHYCLSQLKTMWMLMRNNLSFSDEGRTLFVTTALLKFLDVAQRTQSALHGAVFRDPEDLNCYEKVFHTEVFQPTLQCFEDNTFVDEKMWQRHSLLTSIRAFSATYPIEPTYKDFLHSLEHVQGAGHMQTSHELSVLCKFVREKQRLRIGGLLLPDLVEFYMWLHQQLSHLMTMNQALDLSVGDVVERLANRYSKGYADYIRKLFSRVQENYNKYVELSGGVIGHGACLRVHKDNVLKPISRKDTKLAQLLSESEEEGDCPDALFVVIRALVTAQNDFVQAVITDDSICASDTTISSRKFLPANEGEVSALELGWHNCLMGDITPEELQPYLKREVDSLGDQSGQELMKIISRHHLYVPGAGITQQTGVVAADLTASLLARYNFKASTMFEFHRLQQDIVTQFIVGKPFIIDPAQIRIVFRYRQQQAVPLHSALRSSDNAEAHVDLPTLQHELQIEFKCQLSAAQKKELDIIFHNLNYRDFVDLMKALRAVAGHLCQAVMEIQSASTNVRERCEELARLIVCDFLLRVYNESIWSYDLETRIGFPQKLADRQRKKLLQLHLSHLYETLAVFHSKLCDGEYEFAHLPLSLKTPLPDLGTEAINNLPAAYSERGEKSATVEGLRQFDQTLHHSERFLEQEAKKSLVTFLVDNKFYDAGDLPICCLSHDIKVEHYMHVRLTIQKILHKLLAKSNVSFAHSEAQRWTDVISMADEFPQLFQQLKSEPSQLSKLPVYKLGGEGGLYHPLWFEKASDKEVEDEDLVPYDSDEDDGRSEFDHVEDQEHGEFFIFNTEDSSLPPIYVLPDQVQRDTSAGKIEEEKATTKTAEAAVSHSDEWETIDVAEGQVDVVNSGIPVVERVMDDKELKRELLEAAAESITEESTTAELGTAGATGTLTVTKLLEMCSPDQIQQLLREAEKDLSFMSVDDVAQFLESHGFGQYTESFRANSIDGGDLQELQRDALKELGVTPLHCSKILKLIKQEKKK